MVSQNRINQGLYWDRAWYLTHGCRPRSPACVNCWAAKGANVRQHNPHPTVAARHAGIIDPETRHFNGRINLDWDVMDLPLKTKKPTVWSVWDELFYGDEADREWCERRGVPFEPVPEEFIYRVLDTAIKADWHTIIILTKRAARMCRLVDEYCVAKGLSALPAHIVGMVTAENQQMADERIPYLLRARLSVRGVSTEPLLEAIDLRSACWGEGKPRPSLEIQARQLEDGTTSVVDWIAAGCESGAHRRHSKTEWFRLLRDTGIPFFLKQMEIDGKVVKMPLLDGRRWDQLPVVRE